MTAKPLIPEERQDLYLSMTKPEEYWFIAFVKNFHTAVFDEAAAQIKQKRAEQTGSGS